jgi:WD40 repeat protein
MKPHGVGKITLLNGTTYEGEFKNGDYHGQGTRVLPNGESYSGEWEASKVGCLAVLSDGRLVSGSHDGGISAWENGARVLTLQGHALDVCALAVLPNGMLASGSQDHTVRVWR